MLVKGETAEIADFFPLDPPSSDPADDRRKERLNGKNVVREKASSTPKASNPAPDTGKKGRGEERQAWSKRSRKRHREAIPEKAANSMRSRVPSRKGSRCALREGEPSQLSGNTVHAFFSYLPDGEEPLPAARKESGNAPTLKERMRQLFRQ